MSKLTAIVTAGLVAISSVSALAASKAEKAEKVLAKYTTTGETVQCISSVRIKESKALDRQTILFTLHGGKTYLNRLPQRCSGLNYGRPFTHRSGSESKLCSSNAIFVSSAGIGTFANAGLESSHACALGRFERLEKKTDKPS